MRKPEIAGLATALLLAISMWFYVQHVMIGVQVAEAAKSDIPRGNLSDLYPRWLGARELLLHHRDPYSPEITREIQTGYYGRPLDSSRPNDPRDQQGFAYPLYVVFLLAPTIRLPFSAVQIGFFWLLVIVTIGNVLLWLRKLQWHPSTLVTAMFLVLSLGSIQVLQGLKLQQLTLLVSGLIAGSIAALGAGHMLAAGILLALATIKPQLMAPLAAWLMLWASSQPQRKKLAWSFIGALFVLIATSEFLLSGWIREFYQAMQAYREYNGGAFSVLQVLLSHFLGNVVAILVLLATGWQCWRLRQSAANSPAFNWMTAVVLAATVLVMPKTSPYNHVLLSPGLLILVQNWRVVWGKGGVARSTFLLAGFIFFWPWLAALALTIVCLFSPAGTLPKAWMAPMYTILAIPVAVYLLLAFSLSELREFSAGEESVAVPPG